MKTNKASHTATLAEANKGVAFTNIESLPAFTEADYSRMMTEGRNRTA